MKGISLAAKATGRFLQRNSPQILIGIAIAGVVTTAVMAAKATPAAIDALDEQLEEWPDNHDDPDAKNFDGPLFIDEVKVVWKLYIPAVISGGLTVTAILLADRIQSNRIAAAVGAYSLAEAALAEYQDAVLRETDKKTFEKIRDNVAQTRLDGSEVPLDTQTAQTGGSTLCYDSWTGRYFNGSVDKIQRAVNEFNHRLINDTWMTLNELYSEIGLENAASGEGVGWTPDRLVELTNQTLLSPDNVPCYVLDFRVRPKLYPYSYKGTIHGTSESQL